MPVRSERTDRLEVTDSSTVFVGARPHGEPQWRYVDVMPLRRGNQEIAPEFPADDPLPDPKQSPRK